MQLSTVYLASAIAGGFGLLVVWYLMQRVRRWAFPVRSTAFDVERDADVAARAAERGPSGAAEGEVEAEAVDRGEQSLWDRMKLGLYTYQKRPRKVR